jgi:hypothetical protein
MTIQYANNATSTLASPILAGDTSLTVVSGQGARFPTPSGASYFLATLTQNTGTETSWEIVRVTARSGDTFTITRGQEGTAAAGWAAGSKVELRLTQGSMANTPQLDSDNTFSGYLFSKPLSNSGAGVVPGLLTYIQNADRTGTNVATAQGLLGNTTGLAVTLQPGRYMFDITAIIGKSSASATSLQFAIGGTATLAFLGYTALSHTGATLTTLAASSEESQNITTGFSTLQTVSVATAAAAAVLTLSIKGFIDVTVAGTVLPQFAYTVAPTVGTIYRGTRMSIYPVSATGADTNVGGWA